MKLGPDEALSLFALEYSKSAGVFHIQEVENMLDGNLDGLIHDHAGARDFIPISFFKTRAEAEAAQLVLLKFLGAQAVTGQAKAQATPSAGPAAGKRRR